MKRMWALLAVLFLLAGLVPAALAQEPVTQLPVPETTTGTARAGGSVPESLSGSFVAFDPSVGGSFCYLPGAAQTFCFRAESFTSDWEYVYNVWERLPADWTVNNVYVLGTPSCDGGGTWGIFSWGFGMAPYEVDISHARYQANPDHCTAYYCFEVTSGGPGFPNPALESWYWDGDGYGDPPHNPCSNDNYTPAGQSACDEAIQPQASIPPCAPLMLTPAVQSYEGCACEGQGHYLTAWNFDVLPVNLLITYTVVGPGTGGGPINVGPIPPGGSQEFPVTLRLSACSLPSQTITMTVEAVALETGNTATATLAKHNLGPGYWEWLPENMPLGRLAADWWGMGDGIENYGDPADQNWWMTGGVYDGAITAGTWYWSWNTMTWVNGGDMPNAVYRTEGDVQNNDMYNVGGSTGSLTPQDYNTQHQDGGPWVVRAPAPTVSMDNAIEAWPAAYGGNDHSYLVGGYGMTPTAAYEYDPVADTWATRAANPFTPIGYPMDGCFGWTDAARTDPVIIQFPDATGSPLNLLVYHIVGDSWEQWPIPAGFPANGMWAPDIAIDYDHNLCYITGGATVPGTGDLTSFYIYSPASNTVARGPDFTTPRDFHASWYFDRLLCIAGGNSGGAGLFSTQCAVLTECQPCDLTIDTAKMAPPAAAPGEVISYTLVFTPSAIEAGMIAMDPLPPNVVYTGNLTWDAGFAWYEPADNTVYWMPAPPSPPKRTLAVAAPPAGPLPDGALDIASGSEAPRPAPSGPVAPLYVRPEAVLWDNGPLVTHPGACSGQDASRLQSALGMTIYGFGHQFSLGNHMADDFEIIDPLGWQIDTITFFAYQTDAPIDPSPIAGVYYQIWDGPPNDPGSSIVFGDLVTNRLLSSTFSNIQRDLDSSTCPNARYVFADTASAGVVLPPGTYWIDWMTDGSVSFNGPWAPSITILGQTTTGNAMQYTSSSGAWQAAMDVGQQGMPFTIEGQIIAPSPVHVAFNVVANAPCGDNIWNEGLFACGMYADTFAAKTQVVGEPDIVVEPMALWDALCPDSTDAMTLTICNAGNCPLWWMLLEVTPSLGLAGSMPFVPVSVAAKGSAPEGLTVSSPAPEQLAQPVAAAHPEAVLWDQPLSVVSQVAYVDQEFPDVPAFSSFLADDFVNGTVWLVNSIFVPGNLWNGATDLNLVTSLTWQIYADCAGIPCGDPSGGGNPPVWTLTLPPSDPQVVITTGSGGYPSDTTLNLAAPIVVPPGTWWLVFYATAEVGTWGQYGRQPADTTNGYAGQFINPGGGFGLGTDWQDWTVLGPAQPDIAFRLEGTAIQPGDIPWLTESPISGTVPAGGCQPVDVTFDSTGLLPADYTGDLLIVSNDPDTATVTVPATLTVETPVTNSAFTWDPLMPAGGEEVTFYGTATGTLPFTYTWEFSDGGTGTGQQVTHTFATAGSFVVTLTVGNDCGDDMATDTVTVAAPVYSIYLPLILRASTP